MRLFFVLLLLSSECLQAAIFNSDRDVDFDFKFQKNVLELDFDLKKLAYSHIGIEVYDFNNSNVLPFNFTIENWPTGVSTAKSQWDRGSVAQIRKVIDTLRFRYVPFIFKDFEPCIFEDGPDGMEYSSVDPFESISNQNDGPNKITDFDNDSVTTARESDSDIIKRRRTLENEAFPAPPKSKTRLNINSAVETSVTKINSHNHDDKSDSYSLSKSCPFSLPSMQLSEEAEPDREDYFRNTGQLDFDAAFCSFSLKEGRKLLRDKFIQKYYDLSGKYSSTFRISRVNISGWPSNIRIRSDKWTKPDIQILNDVFDEISFSLRVSGEPQVITDIDGNILQFDRLGNCIDSSQTTGIENLELDSRSNDMIKILRNELLDLARKQLGLQAGLKIRLRELEIINWPVNVPLLLHCSCWKHEDMEAIIEVKDTFKFRYHPDTNSKCYQNHLAWLALKDGFLSKSNKATGKNIQFIFFSKIHIKGWPVGVGIRPDKWNSKEVNILEECFDNIVFTKIQKNGETPVVIDINGNVLNFDSQGRYIKPVHVTSSN